MPGRGTLAHLDGCGSDLVARIRTALSLDSFGFTIYKLLQAVQTSGKHLREEEPPRNIGLFLIAMGTVAMIRIFLKERQHEYG